MTHKWVCRLLRISLKILKTWRSKSIKFRELKRLKNLISAFLFWCYAHWSNTMLPSEEYWILRHWLLSYLTHSRNGCHGCFGFQKTSIWSIRRRYLLKLSCWIIGEASDALIFFIKPGEEEIFDRIHTY
nr:MAG TPA: hypothetical protein [Caudoviricetes sp.]